ncbi:hypothetical protein WA158_005050 [Blastocystis sp. Blastoise]
MAFLVFCMIWIPICCCYCFYEYIDFGDHGAIVMQTVPIPFQTMSFTIMLLYYANAKIAIQYTSESTTQDIYIGYWSNVCSSVLIAILGILQLIYAVVLYQDNLKTNAIPSIIHSHSVQLLGELCYSILVTGRAIVDLCVSFQLLVPYLPCDSLLSLALLCGTQILPSCILICIAHQFDYGPSYTTANRDIDNQIGKSFLEALQTSLSDHSAETTSPQLLFDYVFEKDDRYEADSIGISPKPSNSRLQNK